MVYECSERVFKVIDTNNKERFFKLFSYLKIRSKQIFYFYEVYEIFYEKRTEVVYERQIYSDEYILKLSLTEDNIGYKSIEEIKR
jgi:hypothetical protein